MTVTLLETPVPPPAIEELDPTLPVQSQPLTVETLLWVLVGGAALLFRLLDIARWPLSEREAALALETWHFVAGQPYEMNVGGMPLSPLAFNLSALLFALFGASDAAARVAQALGGTALMLSPWLLRPFLGRGHALAVSMLLLLSPSSLFFSRHASGEVWAALCAMGLIAGVAHWLRAPSDRSGMLVALALGLGLASSPAFWSVLVAGALLGLWRWRQERETFADTLRLPEASSRTRYGAVAGAAFLISTTGFFTNLQGLGAAFALPVEWASSLLGGGPELALPFLFVLLMYEILPLLTALVGSSLLIGEHPQWTRFLLLWTAVTVVPATLANSGWTAGIFFAALPLALLGGAVVVRIARQVVEEGSWQIDGFAVLVALGLLIYFWLNLAAYLSMAVQPNPHPMAWATSIRLFMAVGLFIAGAVALNLTYGAGTQRRVLGLTLLLLFSIISLSSAWGLSFTRGGNPREPLVTEPSRTDLRTGAAQLEQISIERYRKPHAIPLGIQRTLGYAPRWYFRNFENVTLVEGSYATLPEAALLDEEADAPPERIGQRVWSSSQWQRPSPLSTAAMFQWLTTREESTGYIGRAVTLYVTLPQQ
ncbi:MAG: hypothetical protein H0T73_20215 [Ardenticatenales bacterium]|nr:hypothetical protein [Ardenticatenales bacterium]